MMNVGCAVARLAATVIVFGIAGCGGGNGAAPQASAPVSASALSVVRTVASAPNAAITVLGFGGLKGLTYAAHTGASVYDYAEDVTVDFDRAVDMTSFAAKFTIVPAAPWTPYVTNYGKRVQLTIRKTPGVEYTLTFGAGLLGTDGTALATNVLFRFTTTANVTIPAPLRRVSDDPYRLGLQAHPSADSLGGPNAAHIANIIQSAGAVFVRVDYAGSQVTPSSGAVDFAPSDEIVSLLAARGITVLPLLEQYSGASWQTAGRTYPSIYATPQLYAQYVGTVVAHLRATAPQITRVELFNEPNVSYWWSSPYITYSATNGSATATYMQAAYAAAKAANPAIIVVGPGLADGGTDAVDPRTFLTQMYASGCRTGTCWDVLSIHPYAWIDPSYTVATSAANRFLVYQDLQAIAVAHGDAQPHVMLTEWSYSTVDEASGFDAKVQARYLATGFNLVLADPTVDGVVWTTVFATGSDFWSRTAITDASYNPLPAVAAFHTFVAP